MPIHSIMVQLDLDEPVQPRLEFAAALSKRFGAHLVGFAAGKVLPIVSTVDGATIDVAFYQEQVAYIENCIKNVRKEFEKIMSGSDVSFRGAVGDPAQLLARNARAADLIIAGVPVADTAHTGLDLGDFILNAGRPLLLPTNDHKPLQAKRILIAWKDTREARRAVADAIPFLSGAEEAIVLTLGEDNNSKPEHESLADVARYLERHVARVSTELVDTGSQMQGEVIAKIASEKGADMVVAGAYGHSRLREWVFGGVTRELLREGSVSRLFSS